MNIFLVIVCLFIGEVLSIYGELLAAKERPILGTVYGLIGWPFLIFGYWFGYKNNGIWQITAVTLGCVIIVEPILVWAMFHEYPGHNALIGCILGALGIIVASVKD